MKFLRDLLMSPGNVAWDLGRFGALLGFLSITGLAFYKVFAHQDISMTDYGTGYGAVALAAGGLIALKDRARAAGTDAPASGS